MILSVGYRVNSKKGTQFRIWANKVLKEYLVKGYTVNEKRLKEQADQLTDLKNTVALSNVIENPFVIQSVAKNLYAIAINNGIPYYA